MEFPDGVLYIDPYLSDNVACIEGPQMTRQFALPMQPQEVGDATWVLVTHLHLDHCDVRSLAPIALASPFCRFMCPNECRSMLRAVGIDETRVVVAPEAWTPLTAHVQVIGIPAAHPTIERDSDGQLRFLGYLLQYDGRRIYHAGDTSPAQEMLDKLATLGPIDTAFLPVNERNYYREARGIIGNMSVREAFQLASDLKVRTLVPMHWDMFAPNSVYAQEIELLFELIKPPFEMRIYPERI